MKKRENKKYFTKYHQLAILAYVDSNDQKQRNRLYAEIIQPAFSEIVENIVYKYKFTSLPNIETLMMECEGHLVGVLGNFDESKGSKAFSYFSVITKNWFSQKAKQRTTRSKRETLFDNISKDVEIRYLSTSNDFVEKKIREEFIEALWEEIGKWEKMDLKPNEIKILKALKIIFEDPESIDIFSKKAIYINLREITNLNTKQILNNLNKFRTLYSNFKKKWYKE